MMTKRPLATLLAAIALLVAATASAQYSQAPFFDRTLVQSQAYGLELALQRLDVLELVADDMDDDYLEVIEGFEEDLPRFMGTLRARDPELATELEEAIEEVEEAAESGQGLSDAVIVARELVQAAYDTVIPVEVRSDPAFIAALIVDMSLGEGGVGEGYEEAIEGELGEYTMGYAALQRVTEHWSEIAHLADDQHREDVEEMWDFIATLYPTPTIDEPIIGNPEEAEAPVQRVIGLLEVIVDAELFPGRDLAALSAHLPQELESSCQAYEAGENERAREGAIAVGYLYLNADLGDFMEFMAPEVHEEAADLISALTGLGGEDDDEDEGEEESDDEGAEEAVELADPAAACRELIEALREANATLGG